MKAEGKKNRSKRLIPRRLTRGGKHIMTNMFHVWSYAVNGNVSAAPCTLQRATRHDFERD